MNTDKPVITNAASCNALGTNSDTDGNMYLVVNGACVQSFKDADFKSTVEKIKTSTADDIKGATKGFKQEWDLTYTSL